MTVQNGVERENQILKKKIGTIKRMIDRQMGKEIDLQTYLIDMRDKQRSMLEHERNVKRESSRLSRSIQSREVRKRHRTEAALKEKEPSSLSSEDVESEMEDEVSVNLLPGEVLTRD